MLSSGHSIKYGSVFMTRKNFLVLLVTICFFTQFFLAHTVYAYEENQEDGLKRPTGSYKSDIVYIEEELFDFIECTQVFLRYYSRVSQPCV